MLQMIVKIIPCMNFKFKKFAEHNYFTLGFLAKQN
jgi:hypothetical protein